MIRWNPFRHEPVSHIPKMPLYLYNTLGHKIEEFALPQRVHTVRMYNCGPTVYGVQHIGNLSMFVFTNVLRRTLEKNGFPVKQVINITDFGHLTSDADEGEDKMTKGLKREGMKVTMENMAKLAEQYTKIFLEDLSALNIDTTKIEFPRASAYIQAQIAMIKTLQEKGYAYPTEQGVYFDTAHFPHYGALGGIDTSTQKEGARVAANLEKRNPSDFILWKSDNKLGWDSPWGMGFPGWHIECSAMIRATLGEQIDIHTGGIEHISIHHNNEIAQSEAATGKRPFSRFWMHRAHIQIEGSKIAKSDGNVVYLADIAARGVHPLALRYLFLGAQYRSPSNFSWESLSASQTAFAKILAICVHYADEPHAEAPKAWIEKFMQRINDDLDTPGALSVLWDMIKDKSLSPAELRAGLLEMDEILGLNLSHPDKDALSLAAGEIKEEVQIATLPVHVIALITDRSTARRNKQWEEADELREKIEWEGYTLEDTGDVPRVFRK